ncbi:MAG: DUF4294 domain-containing protein [Bacteroidia bacterium]|nr:DUF4294 domain-containing protein [Bacteroidia bacterium]MDW8347260.1 DUF4294 domain-containing protein [Bacteroidia bacterium]
MKYLLWGYLIAYISYAFAQSYVERDGEGYIVPKDEEGIPMITYPTVFVVGSTKRRVSDKEAYVEFSRLRYNVIKLLPYANEAARRMAIIEADLAKISDKKERKKYIEREEKRLFGDFQEDVEDLSINQGKILIKLIHRQTKHRAYDIIKEMKGSTTAFFWQGVCRIFGTNLKLEYDPEQEAAIEAIIESLGDAKFYCIQKGVKKG